MSDDQNENDSASGMSSVPETPVQPPSWTAERDGKGIFWGLLFSPALLCLIALTILLKMGPGAPDAFWLVVVPALGICGYLGYWVGKGFHISTTGKVFASIGLALAFVLLNAIIFFGGCLALVVTSDNTNLL